MDTEKMFAVKTGNYWVKDQYQGYELISKLERTYTIEKAKEVAKEVNGEVYRLTPKKLTEQEVEDIIRESKNDEI